MNEIAKGERQFNSSARNLLLPSPSPHNVLVEQGEGETRIGLIRAWRVTQVSPVLLLEHVMQPSYFGIHSKLECLSQAGRIEPHSNDPCDKS